MDDKALTFTVDPTAQNHFAWVRTLMGLERTHMAAVRTAAALIGFGFTVAEFFRDLREVSPEPLRQFGPHTPRHLGLVLIGAGVIALAAFTVQFSRAVAYLRDEPFAAIAGPVRYARTLPVYVISYAVLGIGVAAFVSVAARM